MCSARALLCRVVLVATAASSAIAAEGVEFKPKLEAGASWAFDIGFEARIASGDTPPIEMTQHARLRLGVVETDGDGGATVSASVESVSLRWIQGEEVVEFALGDEVGDDASPRLSAVSTVLAALAASDCALRVGADGEIHGSTGFAAAYAAVGEFTGDALVVAQQCLGPFAPAQFTTTAGSFWSVGEGGPQELVAGDTWEESRPLQLGPAGKIELLFAWRVVEATGDTVRLAADLTLTTPNDEADGTAMRVEVQEHEGSIDSTWSAAEGVLDARRAEQSMTLGLAFGAEAVEAVRHVTITIERVKGE